ncbi:MAG: glycosyltransferase, partial [Ignavibacteriaceae bacterium]|nr:glycosyltransferase [Ignavibacteriaceae bacterium]
PSSAASDVYKRQLITNPKFDYVVASQEVISDFPLIRYCQSFFKKAEVYKKFVLTYHNTVTLINQSFGGSLGKRDFKIAMKIRNKYITKQIAVSPGIKKLAQIDNPNTVTVISECIDMKDVLVKSKSGIASKIKADLEDCPYFIVLARISPVKNLKLAINAFAKFEVKYKNFKLVIAGRVEYPGYFKELLELAGSLNLGGKVIFTGEIENPLPLLKNAKALICSSDYEGMPLSIVESMTLNTPVISSMYPGYDFMITQENSLLFLCGDEEGLLQNMINLVDEKVDIKDILLKANKTAQRFDVSTVGEIYHNYFRTRNLTEY